MKAGACKDPKKHYKFHSDYGHDTEDYYQLKREMEALFQ